MILEARRVQVGKSFHSVTFEALGSRWRCDGTLTTYMGGDGLEREAWVVPSSVTFVQGIASSGGYDALVARYAGDVGLRRDQAASLLDRMRWGEGRAPDVETFLEWVRPQLAAAALEAIDTAVMPSGGGFTPDMERAFAAAFAALGGGFDSDLSGLAPAGGEEEFRAWVRDLVRVAAFAGYQAGCEQIARVVRNECDSLRREIGGL